MVNLKTIFTAIIIFIAGSNLISVASASDSTGFASPPVQFLRPSFHNFQLKQRALNAVIGEIGWNLSNNDFEGNSHFYLKQKMKPKSKGKAFLRSLIMPGWGQYYAESKTMMKAFIVAEVLVWGSYLGFTTWSNWLEDDFRTFSVTHAGVNLEGKPDRYFVDIGNFDDIDDYNQTQLRERDLRGLYPENEDFSWRWDNEENRRKFKDIRLRRDRANNRASFALASIFLNRVVSAIHSTLAVHKFNQRHVQRELGFRIDFEGFSYNRQVKIRIAKSF